MIHKGTSVILQSKDGKFLLQLRDNKKEIQSPNKWSFFGGGVEKGESPVKTAVREMNEELELKLKEKNLSLVSLKKSRTHKHYLFLSKTKINPSKLVLHEGQAMRLFSRKEIIFLKGVTLEVRLFFIFNKLN
jgi:8-oxo-dGTP diphosphatase